MKTFDGYDLCRTEEVSEIDGQAHILRHKLSGARILWLENKDVNKSFSIAFKTPPTNSTGVFHILEHSVLCGSKKYPVKEPFVNLLKSSMQTFLNAMTFPDKTVYPVASTNEQDLMNLMSVYLDAVFNPRIYESEEIFLQEGWHKEVDAEGKVGVSGVVFNEMQGALSDPDSVLFDALCERLYPESAYSFESGGDPKHIPDLTYEQFLDTHKKHYTPENSYITLYGDLNVEKFLKFLDEQCLTPAHEQCLTPENAKLEFNVNKPVCGDVLVKEMNIDDGMTTEAIAFRLANAGNVVDNQAVSVLMDAVMSSNVSPLKARLLKTGVADDFYATLIEPVEVPALMIACQGVKKPNALQVLELETLAFFREWAENGVDKALLEAAINHEELVMREHNFGTADGVVYSLDVLSTWLYDENKVTDALKFESIFAELRSLLNNGGFENVIRKYILGSQQTGIARAKIVKNEQKVVQNEQFSLASEEEKNRICENVAHLQAIQSEPDSAENIAKLPYLMVSDIQKGIKKHKFEVSDMGDSTVLFHKDLATHGLAYFNTYFDMRHLNEVDIFYISLLTSLLGKFDTDDFTAEEIDLKAKELLGKCRFNFSVPNNKRDLRLRFLSVSASCLEGKTADAAALLGSILNSTSFDNIERLRQNLNMLRLDMQASLVNSGHVFAKKRAMCSLSWRAAKIEDAGGIGFYQQLCKICDNFDENLPKLKEKLNYVLHHLASEHVYFSTSVNEDALTKWQNGMDLQVSDIAEKEVQMPASSWLPTYTNEAFSVKSDVTFSAVRSDLSLIGDGPSKSEFSGKWAIASRALSYDYLWNTIRVKGGAYGCGFSINPFGEAGFYTFRDPKAKQSLQTIAEAGNWLKSFSPTKREFDGFVVSSVAEFDKPAKPSALIARGDSQFFAGTTEDDRERIREEVLCTKLEDVQELAQQVSDIASTSSVCVVGNKQTLQDLDGVEEITEL